MSDRHEDILRKIRALIAKADDPATTPEESQSFRDGADRLMTKYAVEEMELLRSGRVASSIEAREVDITWWYDTQDADVRSAINSMFNSVYDHCRCRPVYSRWSSGTRTMKCVGFKGDLDWADMLFTSLLFQLQRSVDPRPGPGTDYFDALQMCRHAGLSWDETWYKLVQGGVQLPPAVLSYDTSDGQRDKMIRDYRRICKERGIEQNYNHYRTFRRSYTQGFISGLWAQLRDLRYEQDAEDGSGTALVLRDVRQSVAEWMWEQFPETAPPPPPTEEELEEMKKQREADRKKRHRRVAMPREKAVDYAAQHAGWKAGREADIHNSPGERIGRDTKGIES